MALQTATTLYHQKGYVGQEAGSNYNAIVSTGRASGEIPFGSVVINDGTDTDVTVPDSAGTAAVRGVALREINHEVVDGIPSAGETAYRDNTSVSIMEEGFIYLEVTGAVARGGKLDFFVSSSTIAAGEAGSSILIPTGTGTNTPVVHAIPNIRTTEAKAAGTGIVRCAIEMQL